MQNIRRSLLPLLLSLLALSPMADAQLPNSAQAPQLPTLAPMLEKVRPAVVNIATRGSVPIEQNPLLQDPFFRRFFGAPEQMPQSRPTQSLGSGVIVDAEQGYVLTNAHVVEAANEIKVALADGRELSAELVGADPETDIAVLKIETEDVRLAALPFGDSAKLRVGDFVVAVGNPFGLGQTATSGIVSALGRTGLGIEGYEDFIQTDASINPGNSGGALVNLRGELIGINTAILAPAGGNIGIGFAIPIDMARVVADQIIEHGEVRRGRIGIGVQDLTPALAQALNVDARQGAAVSQVLPGSPAAEAGLQVGDVIVAANGQPVDSAAAIRNRVGLMRVGESVELTVVRGGEQQKVTVKIGQQDAARQGPVGGSGALEGAKLATVDVTEDGAQRQRVGVVQVQPGSAAANAGLREGDLILSVNRQPVSTVAELQQALRSAQGKALLHIRRGDSAFFLPLS
jgi:Do/DeqQ family serine protease